MILFHIVLLTGLASWMTLAVINNVVDRKTNQTLLHNVMSMPDLKSDCVLGQKLLPRAIDNFIVAKGLLWFVVLLQCVVPALLWLAVVSQAESYFVPSDALTAMQKSDLALTAFLALWLFFLCGGLWFGYWIKMPVIQLTHFILVVVSLLSIIVIHIH